MNKLLAAIFAGLFAVASASVVIAAEKKEAAKVDCKDPKNKDHKDCTKKK